MMRFSELMKVIEGRVSVGEVRAGRDPEVLGVCEDSRKVRTGDLFVVRKGTKADGGRFVADAISKGAVGVVVGRGQGSGVRGQLEGVAVAEVGDVNLALALLAHEVGGRPTAGMKVIGVTGTKGKTTVAYLMRSVLKRAGAVVGMIGTVEIDDGKMVVPAEMTTPGVVELVELFGRMKGNGVEYVVMEVSSHSLHQHRVGGIEFAVGIFTNLTGDHLDYHGTMEEYAAAKGMLFEGLREGAVAVVNSDDAWGEKMVRGCRGKVSRYSLNGPADWVAEIPSMSASGMEMEIRGPGGISQRFSSPLVGRHNAYNTLSVLAGAHALGIPLDKIIDGLDDMEGVPGRLQPVVPKGQGRQGMRFQVLVDYAHTHDSLENVLKAIRATMGKGRVICVFGCGGDRDRTKRPKMAAVAERLADRVIVTSDNPRTEDPESIIAEVRAGFSSNVSGKVWVEPDRRAAIRMAIAMADSGDVVLIAGKGHENYQIIGTTKHHFDDVEEAEAALASVVE
jgi:UDP-N-acetylmuramoyl-L-alanyl-D-glutamate--2,6-diaminopimelate ligase